MRQHARRQSAATYFAATARRTCGPSPNSTAFDPVDPGPAPRCPHCGVEITRVFEEKERQRLEETPPSKVSVMLREHIETLAGESLLGLPVQPLDHLDRASSLLHHRINSAGLSIAVTFAKASFTTKKALNEILKRHGQGWRFAETVKKRDQRRQGNDARALLTKKDLLADLLHKMYGEATTDATAVGVSGVAAAAQSAASLRSAQGSTLALPAQVPKGKKKKVRETVSLG
eukprot:1317465-Pleurochrysis_carterae.AAC.2